MATKRLRLFAVFEQAKGAVPKETGETHSGKSVRIIVSKGVERASDGNPGRGRVAVTARTVSWPVTRAVMTDRLSADTCRRKISRGVFFRFLGEFSSSFFRVVARPRVTADSDDCRLIIDGTATSERAKPTSEYTATRYELTCVLMRAAPR